MNTLPRGNTAALAFLKQVVLAVATGAALVTSVPGCAAEQAYNPNHLSDSQFQRVTDVCQNVMGLDPSEPLINGTFLGESRLDYDTNHYRGCVLSLSDSLQHAAATRAATQAGEACRAQGYATGSTELALCELNSAHSAAAVPTASSIPVSQTLSRPEKSYLSASKAEHHRRENLACAALGIEPSQEAFTSCVTRLDQTFYAIDNPIY